MPVARSGIARYVAGVLIRRGSSEVSRGAVSLGLAWALSLALGPRIEAVPWHAYDLRSLVLLSKAIVLAKEVSVRPTGANALPLKKFEVDKVYQGPLVPGMLVEVIDDYPRTDGRGASIRFDAQALLFLGNRDLKARSWDLSRTDPQPTHEIVHSGLQLLMGGQVYSFRQMSNPGPIYPSLLTKPGAPQPDGSMVLSPREPVTFADFETEIEQALLIVAAVHASLAAPEPARARKSVLEVLSRTYAAEAAERRKWRVQVSIGLRPRDMTLDTVVEHFKGRGDFEGILEVMVRTERYDFRFDSPPLLAEAERTTCPVQLRAAALRALDIWFTRDTQVISRVVELVGDKDAEVRKAARDRLQYARRGYSANEHKHTSELDAFWAKALARAEELQASHK